MGLEHFNRKESWIAQGGHSFGPPAFDADESVKQSFHLNTDDLYRVTLQGKVRNVTFERWHGGWALFYSPRDDWRYAIWHEDLRRLVKRKRQ